MRIFARGSGGPPMKTKHTPGPLAVIPRMDGDGVYSYDVRPADWTAGTLAYFPFGNQSQDKAKANAHLFAAAPDLLDAVKLILKAWQESPRSHQSHWAEAVNGAAYAIRKATNEA